MGLLHMKLLCLLLSSALAAASSGEWGHRRHQAGVNRPLSYWSSNNPFQEDLEESSEIIPFSHNEESDGELELTPESEGPYSIEKVKQEVIDIEIGILCFLFNVCHYDERRYASIVGGTLANGVQTLDFYLTVKVLLEDKYGKIFSTPKHHSKEFYETRNNLFNRFETLFKESYSSWNAFLPGYNIYNDIFYDFYIGHIYRAYFYAMETKDLEGVVSRMEQIRERSVEKEESASASDYLFEDDASALDQPASTVYHSSVNVTAELEEIKRLLYGVLGFVFNIQPELFDACTKDDKLKKEHHTVIISFRKGLQELYGDIIKTKNQKREGSFLFKDFYAEYLSLHGKSDAIYSFWYKRIYALTGKEKGNHLGTIHIWNIIYVKLMNATIEETSELERKLDTLKAVTLGELDSSALKERFHWEKKGEL